VTSTGVDTGARPGDAEADAPVEREAEPGAASSPAPPSPDVDRSTRWALAALVAGLAAAALAWFDEYRFRSLMGDDIILLNATNTPGGYASGVWRSVTQTGDQKYRPILTVVLSVITDLFESDYEAYRLLNIALLTTASGLAAFLAYRLSRGNLGVAAFVGLAMVVSRFNLYNVLQALGVMENMALCFVLAMLICAQLAYARQRRVYLHAAYVAYALAIYTHERFLTLGAFAVLLALLAPGARSLRTRLVDAAIPVAIAASNYAVKVWVLDVHFLTGGGGQEIEPKSGEIVDFLVRAVLNVFGFNSGPDYLSGRNAHLLGTDAVLVCLAFAVPALAVLVAAGLRVWHREGFVRLVRVVLIGGSVVGPLLLSASITFRQEYRWLFPPYVALLLGLAWAIGVLGFPRRTSAAITALLLASTLAIGVYYRPYADNTYFFAGQETVDSIRDRIFDQHRDELPDSTVFLVTHGDPVLTAWYLGSGAFLRAYAADLPLDLRLVDDVSQAVAGPDTRPEVLVFDYRGDRVVEIQVPEVPAPAPEGAAAAG
jgi:hypothetical protein